MRDKKMTIVERACASVKDFDTFYQKFVRHMTINDRAPATLTNYGRSLALLALHFNSLPLILTLEQVQDYLFTVKNKYGDEGSDNSFKFVICSLRFVYRMEGMQELALKLPPIRKRKKLPVVLSRQEITAMLNIPCFMKHRALIAVLYGCGLRCGEVRNLKITDIDLDREVIHIRQSKGRKDRYVPMGKSLTEIVQKYIAIHKPLVWLFPGSRDTAGRAFTTTYEPKYGKRSINWAIQRAAHIAGIKKPMTIHSLRHTYATHLLEDGIHILAIKELLGHSDIQNTLIYLHVAQINNHIKCSPLDKLQGLKVIGYVQCELNFS